MGQGADPKASYWSSNDYCVLRHSALRLAMRSGSIEGAKALLESRQNPNEIGDGESLFFVALSHDKKNPATAIALGKLLIDHGYDDTTDIPLHGPYTTGERPGAIMLMNEGSRATRQTLHDYSQAKKEAGLNSSKNVAKPTPDEALFEAIKHMDAPAISEARRCGADASGSTFALICAQKQRTGWSPLRAALSLGDVEVFKALLDAGADPRSTHAPGESISSLALLLMEHGKKNAARCALVLAQRGAIENPGLFADLCSVQGWSSLADSFSVASSPDPATTASVRPISKGP